MEVGEAAVDAVDAAGEPTAEGRPAKRRPTEGRPMKVVFLEVDTEREWALASIGPAYLAAYLRRHGHQAEMLRLPVDLEDAAVVPQVVAAEADVVGLSLTTRQWSRARRLVATLRREVDLPVIAGGLHPTFSPEEVLASEGFDAVCLGEGEETLLEFVECLALGRWPAEGEIRNLWLRGGGRPELRPPFDPLDALPFPARDLLDEPPGVAHLNTQRGCPFPCSYCAARTYHDLYRDHGGGYGRRRSHASVLEEIARLVADDVGYLIFLDDTFTLDRRWVDAFCDLYGERFALPFSINARVETVDADVLERLAAAGCRHVVYGVESGSERLRREVLRRPVGNERFEEVFRASKEAGMLVTANYMLGLPEETRDDLAATLDLHDRLAPDDFGYFVFYPYPGTPLFHLCRERGYLPVGFQDLPANHRASILHLPDLTPDDVRAVYDAFTARREALYRRAYGGDHDEAVTERMVQHCAATG